MCIRDRYSCVQQSNNYSVFFRLCWLPLLGYLVSALRHHASISYTLNNFERNVGEKNLISPTRAHTASLSLYSLRRIYVPVSYTHLRAHETDSYLVCRLLLEKKKK